MILFLDEKNAPSMARERWTLVATSLLLCGAALAFRTGFLTSPPLFDELYHLLAARGWLETGQPVILDGEYSRTRWFTGAVAGLFWLTGSDSLTTGRLISVVPGILLPVVLYLWLRGAADGRAALIVAALAILWPHGIDDAQLLRFYAWQVFTFTVGALAVFQAADPRRQGRHRLGWGVLALLSLGVALYLQLTTAIGVAGILLWLSGAVILPAILSRPARWRLLGLLALLGVVVLGVAVASGIAEQFWTRYRWTAGWAQNRQNEVTYYHTVLRTMYPTLWPLFPVAAIMALRRHPRLASFGLVLFGAIFLGQSFGGMKSMRYLSYGMPFFFMVWALALAEILPVAGGFLARAVGQMNPTGRRWVGTLVLAGSFFFVLFANPFFERSIDAARGHDQSRAPVDWSGLKQLIGDWADAPFRLTTHELHTALYLGAPDLLLSESRITELPDTAEFAVDFRTGLPVISETNSLAAVFACQPQGILITEQEFWIARGWSERIIPLLFEAHRTMEVRSDRDLVVMRWNGAESDPDACAALPL